jgi:hypothetical protein
MKRCCLQHVRESLKEICVAHLNSITDGKSRKNDLRHKKLRSFLGFSQHYVIGIVEQMISGYNLRLSCREEWQQHFSSSRFNAKRQAPLWSGPRNAQA